MIKWIKRLVIWMKSGKRKKQLFADEIQYAFLQEALQIEKEIEGLDLPLDPEAKKQTFQRILNEIMLQGK